MNKRQKRIEARTPQAEAIAATRYYTVIFIAGVMTLVFLVFLVLAGIRYLHVQSCVSGSIQYQLTNNCKEVLR